VKFLDADHLLVERTARKTYQCACARRPTAYPDRPGCTGAIAPGERYMEYLGEAPVYGSGERFCWPCGQRVWARWLRPAPELVQ